MEQLGTDHISIKIVQKRLYHAYLGVLRHELLLAAPTQLLRSFALDRVKLHRISLR